MAVPTIKAFDNAAVDLAHIATLATSLSPTATDRLGHTKSTLAGAIASIAALNPRGAWAPATLYAPKDLAVQSGTWYICVVPHTSAASFATDSATKWRVYQGATLDDLLRIRGADQLMAYTMARMAAGATVNVAFFGDSTTDGADTTSWVANPTDGSGNAVGSAAHLAPNAYPIKWQPLIQAMHNNANIFGWNAGYSGKEIADGWALANYDAAVTNNPDYGVPDICLIQFGLNDIDQAGSDYINHDIQTRLLVEKLLRAGTIPVLVGCDPMARNDPAVRDNKESARQIDQIKRAIAAEYRIPFIDLAEDFRRWLSFNRDGKRWAELQPDGLHGADVWHTFKAAALARVFFPDAITVRPGESFRVTTQDSRSNNVGKWDLVSSSAHIAQGRNNFYSTGAPVATVMQTLWVFNESADTEVIYRGLASERYAGSGMVNSPKTRITNMMSGASTTRVPAAVGFVVDGTSSTYRKSDLPYRLAHLDYGLHKIEYISGDDPDDLYYANFEFWQTPREAGLSGMRRSNALKNVGVFQHDFSATGLQSLLLPEFRDGSNVYGLMSTDTVEIVFDVTMPAGAGFIFTNCQTWGGTTVVGDRAYGMVYHKVGDGVAFHGGTVLSGVTDFFGSVGDSAGAVTWTANRATFRLVMNRVGDDQIINVYTGRSGGTALFTVTRPISGTSFPFAGAVGGFFWNGSVAGAGTAVAHEVTIRRY